MADSTPTAGLGRHVSRGEDHGDDRETGDNSDTPSSLELMPNEVITPAIGTNQYYDDDIFENRLWLTPDL